MVWFDDQRRQDKSSMCFEQLKE